MSGAKLPDSAAASRGARTTTPAAWTVVASAARLRIDVTRAPEAARYAPEAVWFEAIPEGFDLEPKPADAFAYRPEFHQIEYVWDFGEAGARFAAPQNLPDAYRDANSATGQITAHVFQTGGQKRVRCIARRVVDAETMEIEEAVAEVTLDIGDPDTLWTEFNTVVVAQDGDFAGAPPGARATTVAHSDAEPWWSTPRHWLTQVNRLIGEGERSIRVLFKRGEAYPTYLFKPNTRAPHIVSFMLFGAWGDPQRYPPSFPRLGAGYAGWSNGQAFVFQGVRAINDYNPITETGTQRPLMTHHEHGYTLFTDVRFERGGSGVVMQTEEFAPRAEPTRLCFHDCRFEALAAYGLYAKERKEDRIAYLGCRDVDIGSAPHGGDLDYHSGNSQGPMRISGYGDWVISGCDFFSRHGWTRWGKWPGTNVDATAEQPCIRVFAGGDKIRTGNGRVVVSRCCGEGGEFLSAASLQDDPAPRGNLVVEQIIHVLSPGPDNFMRSEAGAVTIRNTFWIKPDVAMGREQKCLIFFHVIKRPPEVPDDRQAHLSEPIQIHNNTFVVWSAEPLRFGMFGELDRYFAYEDANNVLYIPNAADDPRHEDLAPYEAEPLWPLRWLGRLEYADNGILQTQYAAPEGSARLLRPAEGSPLIGSARGAVSVVDLLGDERGGTQTRGALEPK